jgi:hypothetical protein
VELGAGERGNLGLQQVLEPTAHDLSVRRRLDRRAHCIIDLVTRIKLLHQCPPQEGGHAERCSQWVA